MPMPEKMHATSSWLARHHLRPLAMVVTGMIQTLFGLVLPATTSVGEGTVFTYRGVGTAVHPRAVIGRNCSIGSGVTIGCRSRHPDVPVIEDDVFIGTGARILGPVTIGAGSVVGANAVVIADVPPATMVVGVPARVIRTGITSSDYADMSAQV